jgi:hypothetical protein
MGKGISLYDGPDDELLFGLAEGPIQGLMGFAPHCGVRPISVHYEQEATFAAAVYDYVKNQVGVAVLAAGPSVTKDVIGVHVAYDNGFLLVTLGDLVPGGRATLVPFGTLKTVGPVAYFSKTGSVLQGPAPEEPGQPTQGILANTGFTFEEIAQLRANKVVS